MMPPPSRVSPVSYAPSKGAAMGSFATVQERVMVAVPRRIAQRGSLALMSWTASSQAELTRRLSYSALDTTKHFPRVLLGGFRSSPACQRPKSRLKGGDMKHTHRQIGQRVQAAAASHTRTPGSRA